MPTLPEIEQRLKQDWPSEPVALDLLRVVSTIEPEASDYITIPLLVQLLDELRGEPLAAHVGDLTTVTLVYRWTEYFATERIGLFDPHFELLRDEDTVTLEPQVVAFAFKNGVLHDPDSGIPLSDWQRYVIPYYSATRALKEILRERR